MDDDMIIIDDTQSEEAFTPSEPEKIATEADTDAILEKPEEAAKGIAQEEIDERNIEILKKFDPKSDSFRQYSERLQQDNDSLAKANGLDQAENMVKTNDGGIADVDTALSVSNAEESSEGNHHVITQEELDAVDAEIAETLSDFDPSSPEAMKIFAKMRENNEGLVITPPDKNGSVDIDDELTDANGQELIEANKPRIVMPEELEAVDKELGVNNELDPNSDEAEKIFAKMHENNEGLVITRNGDTLK